MSEYKYVWRQTERKVERYQAGLSFLIVNLGVPWTYSYQINQCSRGIVLKSKSQCHTAQKTLAYSPELISQIISCVGYYAVKCFRGIKKTTCTWVTKKAMKQFASTKMCIGQDHAQSESQIDCGSKERRDAR